MPAPGAIASVEDARARLADAGAMTLVPVADAVPSLIAGIVGGPVRGSWWSHPAGKQIFAIATGLEDSGDALSAKLIAGKVTFLHRRLWPALARVVTDDGWRSARAAGLSPAAAELLALVERAGEVGADPAIAAVGGKPAFAAARKALEERVLVHAASEHTERGHHAAVLRSWRRWAAPVMTAARALTLEDAQAALAAVGVDLASGLRAGSASRRGRSATPAGSAPAGTPSRAPRSGRRR